MLGRLISITWLEKSIFTREIDKGDIIKEDNMHVKLLMIEISTTYLKSINYLCHL